ncbi:MBL fold metallo-hydrolase [Alloalcanivorax gelatiniphagus]|uniref:MBL fold metallo-hydrolase n=1 Tax=Alloalcanivorax gelatiniphagus TaxID=1194167 RepID=A0ABY2XIH8_9GAMM|nr:MBL fold metallo-hydrolase [Alloalcanivorax gelatiniphagus]TMW10819.1 MBL fold metallo-hydrolase [Alloalcanivorax gelatiniphagus]
MIDWARLEQLAAECSQPGRPYKNRYPTPHHGLRDFLRWQRETRGRFPPRQPFPLRRPDLALLATPAERPRFTWIGHATYLVQYRGWNLLTDPVFSERCSPLSFVGPKRTVAPALSIDELPEIHAVLVSHNHYDHLDRDSVRALNQRFGDRLCWFAPSGVGAWLRRRGIARVEELGWWQHRRHQDFDAFCVPTQHFSGRGARDRNRTLWCGWRLDWDDFSLLFAGDTGYAPVFQEIRQVLGPVDVALLPIGAYQPRWFMAPVHINPDEAVRIHKDLEASHSLAMHWGTFVLTDEPLDEPPRALDAARREHHVPARAFQVPGHGDTLSLLDGGFEEVTP